MTDRSKPTTPLWRLQVPAQLAEGRFSVEREVSTGPMGVLYEGHDTADGQPVTLVVFHPAYFAGDVRQTNLGKLRRALRFRHPNLSPTLLVADEHDPVYVVCGPHLGQPLARWRRESGRIGVDVVYRLMGQLIDAVAVTHRDGIHGAISPSAINVIGGHAWLMMPWSFAIPADMPAGELPPVRSAWLAPERLFDDGDEGPETDVYALGMVLGYLLACGLTEPGHSLMIQGIDVDPAVDEVYVRATARQTTARYRSLDDFRSALEAAAGPIWRESQSPLSASLSASTGWQPAVGPDIVEAVLDVPPTPPPLEPVLAGSTAERVGDTVEEDAVPAFALAGLPGDASAVSASVDATLAARVVGDGRSPESARVVAAAEASTAPAGAPQAAEIPVVLGAKAILVGGSEGASTEHELPGVPPDHGSLLQLPPPLPVAPGANSGFVATQEAVVPTAPPAPPPLVDDRDTAASTGRRGPRPGAGSLRLTSELDTSETIALAAGAEGWSVDAKSLSEAVLAGRPLDMPMAAAGVGDGFVRSLETSPATKPTNKRSAPDAALVPGTRKRERQSRTSRRAVWLAALLFGAAGGVAALLLFGDQRAAESPSPTASGASLSSQQPAEAPPASPPLVSPSAAIPTDEGAVRTPAAHADEGSGPTPAAARPAGERPAAVAAVKPDDPEGAAPLAGDDAAAQRPTTAGDESAPLAAGVGTAAVAKGHTDLGDPSPATRQAAALGASAEQPSAPAEPAAGVEVQAGDADPAREPGEPAASSAGDDAARPTGASKSAGVTPEAAPGFTPVDPKKMKCPGGMAKVYRRITRTLESGAKVKDYRVHCVDRYEYPGAGSKPLTDVTLAQAKAACAARGKHLCSRKEWRGGCGGKYPYRGGYQPDTCNTVGEDGLPRPVLASGAKAGCKSPWGAVDMVGNVAEWTSDGYVNGGSAYKHGEGATCYKASRRAGGHAYVGFRCCASAR